MIPFYEVPVKAVVTEIFWVKADSKEEAMNLALENQDMSYCKSIRIVDGDSEVYYPHIIEVEK